MMANPTGADDRVWAAFYAWHTKEFPYRRMDLNTESLWGHYWHAFYNGAVVGMKIGCDQQNNEKNA